MKNIDSDLIRGNIDTIILKTMLEEDKYGLDIIKEVEQRSNGTYELKQPTLYSCLKRLENQELISSYWLNSDIGGKRHYYKLTDKGREFYNKKQEEWAKSKFVIDNLLSNYDYEEYRLVKKDDYDKAMTASQFIDSPISDESNEVDEIQSEVEISNDNIEETDFEVESEEIDDLSDKEEDDFEVESEEIDDLSDKEKIEDFQEDNISDDESNDFDDEEFDETNQTNNYETVYVSNNDNLEIEDQDNSDDENYEFDEDLAEEYKISDQTENENNILSMLRKQNNEEINDYVGDKKSYANQIKSIYDDVKYVQDDMIFSGNDDETDEIDEVDQKIKEFAVAANELNEFENSSNEEEIDELDEPINEFVEEDTQSETDFEIDDEKSTAEDDYFDELDEDLREYESLTMEDTNSDEEVNDIEEFSFSESDEDLDINNDELDNNYETTELDLSSSDDEYIDYIEDNSEKTYENSNNSFFSSDDDNEYDSSAFEENIDMNYVTNNHNTSTVYDYQQDETYSYDEEPYETQSVENDFSESQSDGFNKAEYDRTFVNISKNKLEESTNYDSSISDNDDIDSIISKNAAMFNESKPADIFEHRYNNQNYKQKLSNLSAYTRISSDENQTINKKPTEMQPVDDIETLKLNFEREGIKIKEFKKITSNDEPEKIYLLANKINLIKSIILFFSFAFVLSAMYVILDNSIFASICEDFSYKYFLIGMIPFAIVLIYNLVIFIISPYKKIPAIFASRIMIFLAVILTVQLLLITYCVNLQLGFFSFTQSGYNHLLWIIPSLISFGPVISNLIYMALFYSGNYNV